MRSNKLLFACLRLSHPVQLGSHDNQTFWKKALISELISLKVGRMSRIVYVNGRYERYHNAHVHIEDRGFQFADAVYEVIEVNDGELIDHDRHDQRLRWSLQQLGIAPPMGKTSLAQIIKRVVRMNKVRSGLVYLQVTRGVARRDFVFDENTAKPTLVVMARSTNRTAQAAMMRDGIKVVTRPDPRWARCDIKTVMLLPASIEKTNAKRTLGAQEVWFVDEQGLVIEGGSSTAWIVDQSGRLRTRPLSTELLPGVTRSTLLDVIKDLKVPFEERSFTVEEALSGREAFITAASNTITPVTTIDDKTIGSGRPGELTMQLRERFHHIAKTSGRAPMDFGHMSNINGRN